MHTMLRKKLLHSPGLYLVLDRQFLEGMDIVSIVTRVLAAGVDMIQLRDKESTDKEFFETGRKIKNILERKGVLFIVNDRVDLAASLDTDGVHIGQEDMPVENARKILGREKVIGLSTHSLTEMREAQDRDVDYISVGPVFHTETKPDYTPVGVGLVSSAARESQKPFVAIGGINRENIKDIVAAGARRVAVVRAVLSAKDPFSAAKNLIEAVNPVRNITA